MSRFAQTGHLAGGGLAAGHGQAVVAGAGPFFAHPADEEYLIVHGQPEQDGDQQHERRGVSVRRVVAEMVPARPGVNGRDIAQRVNELMRDRQLRERFGKAGRKRVEENFSWAAIAEKTKKLYETLKS